MIKKFFSFASIALISFSAFADNLDSKLESARDKLSSTFSKITVLDFKESPIPNMYEVNMGNGVIYFYPDKDLLMFGEMYNKDGENLTQLSLQENAMKLMETLPMESGIVIGDPDGIPLIEFTDPDCPYCRNYERWLNTIKDSYKIKRIVYFDNRIHPQASPKIEHIICSEDKEKAMYEMYHDIQPQGGLKTCQEAEGVMAKHLSIAQALGVSGTPSYFMDGKMVVGFRKDPLTQYFNKN